MVVFVIVLLSIFSGIIIDSFGDLYSYDKKQVHVLGQSNGAAMAYRLGCERADLFASIIPFEGAPPPADYNCTPSEPVHLLHIHGTDDHVQNVGGVCHRRGPF